MKNALAQHLISKIMFVREDSLDPVTDWINQINNLIHEEAISPLEFDRNTDYLRDCVTQLLLDPEDERSKGFYHLFWETMTIDCFSFVSNLLNRDIRLGTIRRHPRKLSTTGEHTQEHYVKWLQEAQLYVDTAFPQLYPETRLVLARLNVAIRHSVW